MDKSKGKAPEKTVTPDKLAKNAKVELTESELKRVSGGIAGESQDHKHKDS
jgi:hypothetical protein